MDRVFTIVEPLLEPGVVVLVLILLLILNAWIFRKIKSLPSEGHLTKRAISLIIRLAGIVVFILVLPIEQSMKGQILSFLGILLSAAIALSSTTILGNLMAGFMDNTINRFRNGDLIRIGDFHGRVTRKTVFHTEIQLEDSNFITIPNLYIANNPVKLIRKSNSVISASVSLGYDVSRIRIENALLEAAAATGLKDPYVYVTELGDYSVVYKIHGFLEDSNRFFSTTSLLNTQILDKLHENGIEIVSPSFMNQRRVDDINYIPRSVEKKDKKSMEKSPEELIFDKAIASEKLEIKKDYLKELEEKLESLKEELKEVDSAEEKEKLQAQFERNKDLKERLEKSIEEQSGKN